MARDIGGYFDKLTKRGRGGRRLDDSRYEQPDAPDADRYERDRYEREPAPEPAPRRSGGGGLGDMLKDILGKGKSTASKTTSRARETINRRRPPKPVSSTQVGGSRRGRGSLPPEGVVSVEYSPRMDGDPDPGEVVWTWVPFEEDPEQGKDRPVVIIGRRGRKLVGVPLTTKKSDREAQINIGTGDWDPKRRTSYARIWRMLDIDEKKTRREGAVLGRRQFDAVVEAVDEYYEVRHPKPDKADDLDYDY